LENWILKTFEELNTRELYAMLELRVNVFIVEQNCPYHELDWQDQHALHLWQEENGKITMYSRIFMDSQTGKGKIGRVIVQKDFRGKGRGKILMEKAIEILKGKKAKTILVAAQADLDNFYGELGFKQVSELYLWDDIPHIDMELKL